MLETALRKSPNDEYLSGQLATARRELAEAEKAMSRNYVVFDDRLIDIIRKYGWAGLTGAGGLAAAGMSADPVTAQPLPIMGGQMRYSGGRNAP